MDSFLHQSWSLKLGVCVYIWSYIHSYTFTFYIVSNVNIMWKREIVNFFMSWSAGDLTRDKCKIRGGYKTRKWDHQESGMLFSPFRTRTSSYRGNAVWICNNFDFHFAESGRTVDRSLLINVFMKSNITWCRKWPRDFCGNLKRPWSTLKKDCTSDKSNT